METFCRKFLLRHIDYEHLYAIIDSYRDRYESIDTVGMFTGKDNFCENFPAVCRTLLRLKGDGRCYVIAILGFALHVHTSCQDADWYELDLMVETLENILTCISFDPAGYYCKPRYYCIIL